MSTSIKAPTDKMTSASDLWRIAETGEIEQLHQLLSRGADINSSNDAGTTALMIAAYHGRLEMVRALTDRGANVNLMDDDGLTAIMLAYRRGHEDIVRTLVARGAKITPTLVVPEASPGLRAQDETFRASDHSETPTHGKSVPNTLHETPNIWEVVPETQMAFDPKSAFIGHLPPINLVVLAAVALILVGGAIFGFMSLRDLSLSPPAASVRSERSLTAPKPTPVQDATLSSSAQQSTSPATEPVSAESPTTQPELTAPVDGGLNPVISKTVEATRASEGRHTANSPRQQDQPRSTGSDTFFREDNQANTNRAREITTRPPKIDGALPQPAVEQSGDAIEVKKQGVKKDSDKAQSPLLAVPARASPTPKLK